MENTGKFIAGTLMIVLALGIYFFGASIITLPEFCDGWGAINPVCWATSLLDTFATVIFAVIAVWTALFAIAIFAAAPEKTIWIMLLYFALTFSLINLIIPDPIPWIDELIGFGFSALFGLKALGDKAPEKLQVF